MEPVDFEEALRERIAEAVERELAPVLDLLDRLSALFQPGAQADARGARPEAAGTDGGSATPDGSVAPEPEHGEEEEGAAGPEPRIQVLKPHLPRPPREEAPAVEQAARSAIPPTVRRNRERDAALRAALAPQLAGQLAGKLTEQLSGQLGGLFETPVSAPSQPPLVGEDADEED